MTQRTIPPPGSQQYVTNGKPEGTGASAISQPPPSSISYPRFLFLVIVEILKSLFNNVPYQPTKPKTSPVEQLDNYEIIPALRSSQVLRDQVNV